MSVELNIDIAGSEELNQALSRLDAAMQQQLHDSLSAWAEKTRAEAQRLVPVRTGYLRSTISARTHEWQTEIGAEASYAAAVELGTSTVHAQPFLNPAVESQLPELERQLLQAIDAAKTEAGL
jgi:HK97 gp10 family phage protein